jgi:iron only hydrogenase large subunit-like protein
VNLDGRTLRVAVADGLQNAKVVLDRVLEKQSDYHIVEVMACPGGCSGGGGQPYPSPKYFPLDARLLEARGRALYSLDSGKKLRRSHHNPAIKQLYDEYFDKVGSEKSHQLLHTSYRPQNPRGVRRIP